MTNATAVSRTNDETDKPAPPHSRIHGVKDALDGTLEHRLYYIQNWRADVVALVDANHELREWVRYDPYGTPYGMPQSDTNGDGTVDSTDNDNINNNWWGTGAHPTGDHDLDHDIDIEDLLAQLGNDGDTLGWGALSLDEGSANNRKGYAGYEHLSSLAGGYIMWHVRYRVLNSELGRWTRRDPLGYVDGVNLYGYARNNPQIHLDWIGLWTLEVRPTPCLTVPGTDPNDPHVIDIDREYSGCCWNFVVQPSPSDFPLQCTPVVIQLVTTTFECGICDADQNCDIQSSASASYLERMWYQSRVISDTNAIWSFGPDQAGPYFRISGLPCGSITADGDIRVFCLEDLIEATGDLTPLDDWRPFDDDEHRGPEVTCTLRLNGITDDNAEETPFTYPLHSAYSPAINGPPWPEWWDRLQPVATGSRRAEGIFNCGEDDTVVRCIPPDVP